MKCYVPMKLQALYATLHNFDKRDISLKLKLKLLLEAIFSSALDILYWVSAILWLKSWGVVLIFYKMDRKLYFILE
jgi:hypothetical protein